jgi:hypothetical protein
MIVLKEYRISRRRGIANREIKELLSKAGFNFLWKTQEFRQLFTVIIILGCYCDRHLSTVWIPRRYQHRYRHNTTHTRSLLRNLQRPTSTGLIGIVAQSKLPSGRDVLIRFRLRDSGSVHADPTVLRGTLLAGSG